MYPFPFSAGSFGWDQALPADPEMGPDWLRLLSKFHHCHHRDQFMNGPATKLGPMKERQAPRQLSGQEGDVSSCTLPPRTTKRRTTKILKTKNNQNCQKIELYGSLTTKELKNKHSSRPEGGVETGSQSGKDLWQSSGWRARVGEEAAGGAASPTFAYG